MAIRYKNISAHVKNKEQTMQRLIDAVGSIIGKSGYKGLGLNAVAREADVSKILVHRYFGGLDQLVEAYVLKNDYWIARTPEVVARTGGQTDPAALCELVVSLLQGHFEYFNTHPEMRSIILWEISERTALLNSISHVRESMGNVLLEKAAPLFENSQKNIKAVTALMVSGIYYMILHSKKNESEICGIDVNSAKGQKEILDTIKQIIEWAFSPSEQQVK